MRGLGIIANCNVWRRSIKEVYGGAEEVGTFLAEKQEKHERTLEQQRDFFVILIEGG